MARNKHTGTVLVAVFGKGALIRQYSANTSTDPQGKGKLRSNFSQLETRTRQ